MRLLRLLAIFGARRAVVLAAATLLLAIRGISADADRTGRLLVTLELPRGEEPPAALTLELHKPQSTTAPLAVACSPLTDGRWSCVVPAGTYDVRIEANKFVPHYLWNVTVPPDAEQDAGRLTLRRGPSISGRVVVHDGDLDAVRIRLVPAGQQNASGANSVQVKPNARGFFQFGAVELGRYDLSATRDGASPAHLTGVVIDQAREYVPRNR